MIYSLVIRCGAPNESVYGTMTVIRWFIRKHFPNYKDVIRSEGLPCLSRCDRRQLTRIAMNETSAGSQVATLFAAGFSQGEIKDIVENTPFKKFKLKAFVDTLYTYHEHICTFGSYINLIRTARDNGKKLGLLD